ncbi:MAG TPA: acyl-CoA dehydrogenase family protein [Stellaceae bacterium]|jgi:alkylation response protein AidB-like acyl-CoA dehydrogenase
MDFGFTDEQTMLRDSVKKLMDKHAPPEYIRRLEREQAYPYELYDEWIRAGLLAMPFPEKYGGLGGNAIDMAIIAEEISYRSTDLSMALGGSMFCGLNLVRKATEEQKQYWLPKLLSGEIRMSISMSEPDAGSDIGAMRTTAVLDGNEWVINGQKLWATGAAAKNNVINMYVKTDPKAHYRQGMSLFLIDKDAPGLEMRKLDMLGRRCTGTYEVFLKDVRIPADRLVGGDAGLNKGFDFVLSGLQVERVVAAAGSCGGARAVVDLASSYAKERKQFGKPIGTFQAIAHMLADMETEVEAARSLMWRAAWMVASGQNALKEITMAKLYCGETYAKVANMGMQVLGGYGYNKEFDMERHYRDARVATVAAGSSQMQRNLIANLMGHKVQ